MKDLLFYATFNSYKKMYECKDCDSLEISFCYRILEKLSISTNAQIPFALSFYKGGPKSFCLKRVVENEWVKEKHKLNGSFDYTEVMIERKKISYFFDNQKLIEHPVNINKLFDKFGEVIYFDCYYHML